MKLQAGDVFTLADVKAAAEKMRSASVVPCFESGVIRVYLSYEEGLRYRAAQRYLVEVSYGLRYNPATKRYEQALPFEEYVEAERLRDARQQLVDAMAHRCAMLGSNGNQRPPEVR